MPTVVASILSVDGNLELALCPASIELRLSAKAAKEFDEACESEKSSTWLPLWKQIKAALLSAAQFMSHRFADKLRNIPLEAVQEVRCREGRLEVVTAQGNQIAGHIKIEVGSYKLEYHLDDPGIFAEEDLTAFAERFSHVKPLYDKYVAQLQLDT